MKPLIVFTTVPNQKVARAIARALLSKRLAAAVQVQGPIHSTYWWKGKLTRAREWVCGIRTTSKNYAAVEAAIVENHPYEVPEIFALPPTIAHRPYLRWLKENT